MDFMLTTSSRTGTTCLFQCTLDAQTPGTWSYHVRADGSRDFYEARFVKVGPDVVQPDMLENRNVAEYRSKGITEAIFACVVRDSGCRLVSSTNRGKKNLGVEYRTDAADRVWRRLVHARHAIYDASIDRYDYLPPLRVRDIHVPQLRDRVPTGFADNQAELRAKVLDTLTRGGMVAVLDEEDRVVGEVERYLDFDDRWNVRLKNSG